MRCQKSAFWICFEKISIKNNRRIHAVVFQKLFFYLWWEMSKEKLHIVEPTFCHVACCYNKFLQKISSTAGISQRIIETDSHQTVQKTTLKETCYNNNNNNLLQSSWVFQDISRGKVWKIAVKRIHSHSKVLRLINVLEYNREFQENSPVW